MEEKKEIYKKRIRMILIIILAFILLSSITYVVYMFLQKNKEKGEIEEIQKYISIALPSLPNERVEKVKELQEMNSDIKAWIQIEDTKINYPVLQGSDNEYYLIHNYKKEKSKYGSIYLKSGIDLNDVLSNIILYGHDMKDGGMFKGLLNYVDENYYQTHKEVHIITNEEERKYEIIAAFKSRVFYQDEKNVFRYYNYTKFETEEKFLEYISQVDKIKLYDTGVTANYQEQLLTMITCEYSQENGRMVVVAKRVQ